jgi:hypothetical protein
MVDLRREMAELLYEAAKDLASKLGPSKSKLFWGYCEAVARGEISTEEFGGLLERLRGNDKPRVFN